MKFIFKLIFTLFFLVLAVLWILYTISFFGIYHGGWEWVQKIPGISWLNEQIEKWINSVPSDEKVRVIGLQMFLGGGAVLLGYTALYFPLKFIPFFGQLIKFLTCIIPTIAGLALIVGAVLLFSDLSWLPGGWTNTSKEQNAFVVEQMAVAFKSMFVL